MKRLTFLAGAFAGFGLAHWLRGKPRANEPEAPAAAFAAPAAPAGAFVQTRDAGPEHIRDEDGSDWDAVDESSDESFPASDPPAH